MKSSAVENSKSSSKWTPLDETNGIEHVQEVTDKMKMKKLTFKQKSVLTDE